MIEKITINKIMQILKMNSKETYLHSIRVAKISKDFGKFLCLSKKEQQILYLSGLLHDIGKLIIPSYILNKKGKLNENEFEEIKKHPKYGVIILAKIDLGDYISHKDIIQNVIISHHINTQNSYPNLNIIKSKYADIISIIDCFEALTAKRCYKSKMPVQTAIKLLQNSLGYNKQILNKFIDFIAIQENNKKYKKSI